MSNGGFDAVIGNPPYGFHQIHTDQTKEYFKAHYAASQGSFEHYFLFYEAALRLLRKGGTHGFIAPVTWLTIPSGKSLRKFVLDGYAIKNIGSSDFPMGR
jgi:tRNA1(Val) A37 N6-methylase TrmN6